MNYLLNNISKIFTCHRPDCITLKKLQLEGEKIFVLKRRGGMALLFKVI
jgi:hypothetical protein